MLHFGLRLFFMIHKMQTFKIEVGPLDPISVRRGAVASVLIHQPPCLCLVTSTSWAHD